MSRDLNMATPFMKSFAEDIIKAAKDELDMTVIVTSVDRTFQLQMALYAQGRQTLAEVNLLRKGVGLPPITAKDNKQVTWTMASKHIINLLDMDSTNDKSKAIDLGIIINGKYLSEDKDMDANGIPEYKELYLLAKKLYGNKIRYGYEFKKKDAPHYEEVV